MELGQQEQAAELQEPVAVRLEQAAELQLAAAELQESVAEAEYLLPEPVAVAELPESVAVLYKQVVADNIPAADYILHLDLPEAFADNREFRLPLRIWLRCHTVF